MRDLEIADGMIVANASHPTEHVVPPTENGRHRGASTPCRHHGERSRSKWRRGPLFPAFAVPLLVARFATAEHPAPPPPSETQAPLASPPPSDKESAPPARIADSERIQQQLKELAQQNQKLQDEVDRLKEDAAFSQGRVDQLMGISGRVSG